MNCTIINIVSFVVGLTIGLVQLYIAQHQFEVQQREKMDELRKTLTDILQKVAVLEATNSSRAFDIQDKMLQMAAGKAAVSEFTEETSSQLRNSVKTELNAAGLSENIEQTRRLEAQVASIVKSTMNSTGIVDASFRDSKSEQVILKEVAKGRSLYDIAKITGLLPETIARIAIRIFDKYDVKNEIELREKLLGSGQENFFDWEKSDSSSLRDRIAACLLIGPNSRMRGARCSAYGHLCCILPTWRG